MAEIVSEVTSRPSGGNGSGNGARAVIGNTVQAGSLTKLAERPSADRGEGGSGRSTAGGGDGGTIENIVHTGGERAIPDRVRKMLDNLDRHGTVGEPAADAGKPAEAAAAAVAAPAAPATPTAPTAPPPATPPAPVQPAAAPPELERVTARNRELVAENERLRSGGARREPTPREKSLDEIERTYLDNPRDAIRRLAALALGHEDPKHADVTAEIRGLLQDLTAEDLGVSVDQSQQALREAARTRYLLAREQRERKAEQAAASKPSESSDGPDAGHHVTIVNRLQERQIDGPNSGKTIADANPVLKMLGGKPETALLQIIKQGIEAGEMDPKSDNNALIQQAIDKVNSHFKQQHQVLAGIYGGATVPSTAAPTAATETANKGEGQGQAPRSITNASASVAPATPPAKAEITPTPKRPRTEEARRQAIIDRHAK